MCFEIYETIFYRSMQFIDIKSNSVQLPMEWVNNAIFVIFTMIASPFEFHYR